MPRNNWTKDTCFFEPENAYDRGPCENLWGVLWEYGVDGRLSLAVNSLYSRSEVSVRVGGVKSQPFTVRIRLRRRCVLSALIFIVYINWIDSNSWVDEGVTVENYRINYLLFADDLVLHASSEQGQQHTLDRFSVACKQTGMKINPKKTGVLCLSRSPSQFTLQVSGNTFQQV